MQSRINEKANKVWRDTARHTANGKVSFQQLWADLTTKEIFGEFERTEIELDGQGCELEEDFELEELFQEPKDRIRCGENASDEEVKNIEEKNTWLKKFDGILNDSGKAFNPESEQVLVAELRLLRFLHEHNCWNKANDAWLTSLLPVGALIRCSSMIRPLWVLKTNTCAALSWPAIETEKNMWEMDLDVKELTWYTCTNLDEVTVFPTRAASPLSLRMQARALSIRLHVDNESWQFK